MTDEGHVSGERSWAEPLRGVMDRLDRFIPLPPGALRSLGDGGRTRVEPVGEREPVADAIEGGSTVFVTIELPGVSRRDIGLRATETTLVVSAASGRRRYLAEVPLPAPVRTDAIIATYKNGVLDVTLEKRLPGRVPAD